ncbi:MAG: TRAP transporter substrate-binding protein DctP [Alphaproteobacteria bacterium]
MEDDVRFVRCSVFAVLSLAAMAAQAAEPYKVEISLDSVPDHVRNIAIERWAREVEAKSGGKVAIQVYHSAARFKDIDLPDALKRGAVDVGAPGWWQLDAAAPDFAIPGLPAFYGATRQQVYAVVDGPVGKALNARIEKALDVTVFGRWFDLGHVSTFLTAKPVATHADLKGLRIRIPGGGANVNLYRTMGAEPVQVAWPDVPKTLRAGGLDGVQTTYESARSAKLWDAGIRHGFDDRQTFFQYVPMVAGKSWRKMPEDVRKLLAECWEETIDANRDAAAARQAVARAEAVTQGVTLVEAKPADIAAMRKRLLQTQAALIAELKIDPALVAQAERTLDGRN